MGGSVRVGGDDLAAAGAPPCCETLDFSHATVLTIPDALLAVDPMKAVDRLKAAPTVDDDEE